MASILYVVTFNTFQALLERERKITLSKNPMLVVTPARWFNLLNELMKRLIYPLVHPVKGMISI